MVINISNYKQIPSSSILLKELKAYAKKLAPSFLSGEKSINDYTKDSFIIEYSLNNNLPNPIESTRFTQYIGFSYISELCKTSKDPYEIAFLSSKVLETLGRNFFDPRDNCQIHSNLTAAKKLGYFFTPPAVSLQMADTIGDSLKDGVSILDPAAGGGSLLASVLLVSKNKGVMPFKITAIERDPYTCSVLRIILGRVSSLIKSSCKIEVIQGDSLELLTDDKCDQDIDSDYDIIIMNPPYGRLRFVQSSITNKETRLAITDKDSSALVENEKQTFKNLVKKVNDIGKEFNEDKGIKELSKIFLLLSLNKLSQEGVLVIIFPDSWMGSSSSTNLRKTLVENRLLDEILLYSEAEKLFETVNQSTSVCRISKGNPEKSEIVLKSWNKKLNESRISYSSLFDIDDHQWRIPKLSEKELLLLHKLQKAKKIGEIEYIKNRRGELDQTVGKPFFSSETSSIKLVRGDHIGRYTYNFSSSNTKPSFINTEAYRSSSNGKFKLTDSWRIVGRQCSYMGKKRRLIFTTLEPGHVVGNSCNYLQIVSKENEQSKELTVLSGILNSVVTEWYFRIYNSNNHVANYEIDDLPYPHITTEDLDDISAIVNFLNYSKTQKPEYSKSASQMEDYLDARIGVMYGLDEQSMKLLVKSIEPDRASRVGNMVHWIQRGLKPDHINSNGWFQHSMPKLSELDMEMIKSVPQGGNWTNIPLSVPSKRLDQIREMSKERGMVRTTYYGRLRSNQPSYTIATYFNRPGNGTNIHPFENRTISCREAARLQSFPDYYLFLGTEATIRKQIGNAVPPLLAYSIGKHLKKYGKSRTSVDVFCGAGGLSLGLEMAGWNPIVAADNNQNAKQTYLFNRISHDHSDSRKSGVAFFDGDLQVEDESEKFIGLIESKLKGKKLGLLAGGPPCQGFSHAGHRKKGDERNNLASIYLSLAERLKPEVFLLENVEGLLSFDKGKVLEDMILTLKEMGYNVKPKPWVLFAEQYGAPQMRKRVFMVATLDQGIDIAEPPAIFKRCPGRRKKESMKPSLLTDPITVGEACVGLPKLTAFYDEKLTPEDIDIDYSLWLKGELNTSDFLKKRSSIKPTE